MSERADQVPWPVWPLLATAALASACFGAGVSRAWAADLLALLVILSGLELALACLARSALRERARWRWLLLAIAVPLLMALANLVQTMAWPAGQVPHPVWLVPLVGLGFSLLRLLPQELDPR